MNLIFFGQTVPLSTVLKYFHSTVNIPLFTPLHLLDKNEEQNRPFLVGVCSQLPQTYLWLIFIDQHMEVHLSVSIGELQPKLREVLHFKKLFV